MPQGHAEHKKSDTNPKLLLVLVLLLPQSPLPPPPVLPLPPREDRCPGPLSWSWPTYLAYPTYLSTDAPRGGVKIGISPSESSNRRVSWMVVTHST